MASSSTARRPPVRRSPRCAAERDDRGLACPPVHGARARSSTATPVYRLGGDALDMQLVYRTARERAGDAQAGLSACADSWLDDVRRMIGVPYGQSGGACFDRPSCPTKGTTAYDLPVLPRTEETEPGFLGSIGVRFMIAATPCRRLLARRDHDGPARPAARSTGATAGRAPSRHARGDLMGALRRRVLEAGPGDLVFKPRASGNVRTRARSRAGSSCSSRRRLRELLRRARRPRRSRGCRSSTLRALCVRYALEMDPGTVPDLISRFGVRFPGDPIS